MDKPQNILLIGGTRDAVLLNKALFAEDDVRLVTSLAGRTKDPSKLEGDVLIGGFSALGGLDVFLQEKQINWVVDASHPFAAQISRKARAACVKLNVPYIRFDRPPWEEGPQDQWIDAADMTDAARKLGEFNRIFLTVGRQELSAFEKMEHKNFVVRSIEEIDFSPTLSAVCHIQARGPFTVESEISLMEEHRIEVVVSKNSGGSSTSAKIAAARTLSLPVIMIRRPSYGAGTVAHDLDDLLKIVRPSS